MCERENKRERGLIDEIKTSSFSHWIQQGLCIIDNNKCGINCFNTIGNSFHIILRFVITGVNDSENQRLDALVRRGAKINVVKNGTIFASTQMRRRFSGFHSFGKDESDETSNISFRVTTVGFYTRQLRFFPTFSQKLHSFKMKKKKEKQMREERMEKNRENFFLSSEQNSIGKS